MTNAVRYLSDLELFGALVFAKPVNDFPANPRVGEFILKDTCLFGYLQIGDLETWYPFASSTNFYVHTQGLANTTWTINHNLGTSNIWYQVKDQNGNITIVSKTDINNDSFYLHFTAPATGTCVVVAPDSINVPEVKASSIRVGNNEEVVIDTSGVRVNSQYLATIQQVNNVYLNTWLIATSQKALSQDLVVNANNNGLSVGPILVSDAINVTVEPNAIWRII
jgi:hypothetical protein